VPGGERLVDARAYAVREYPLEVVGWHYVACTTSIPDTLSTFATRCPASTNSWM
jgi:hypothetical protein